MDQPQQSGVMANSAPELKPGLYCQYDPALCFESAKGGLRLFLPTVNGYVNYNLVHSVHEGKNCDTWRLGKAYAFDKSLQNEYELTPDGAEWDMALRLSGRPDFIGGYAHGDEVYDSLSVVINGKSADIESILTLTPFDKMHIYVTSLGYDPNDSATVALKHWKEYVVSEEGILLHQRVEWFNGYTLASSYLAMMPPLKSLTNLFYTNADPVPREVISHYGRTPHATEAVVYGETSGISFSMSVPQYPSLPGGNMFSLTDNSGRPYNKMYFVVCNGAEVSKGDVWETTTKYAIVVGAVHSPAGK